jgi:DNA mismatch repair protein MutS2
VSADDPLDFSRVVAAWAEHARTTLGAAAVLAHRPLTSRDDVRRALDAAEEVLTVERKGGSVPVGGVTDVRDAASRGAKGVVLDGAELRGAGQTLEALIRLRKALDAAAEDAPTLAAVTSVIDVDPYVAATLGEAFDPSGQLSGRVYPELAELRTAISRLHDEVRATLDRLVRSEDLGDDLLQDRFWTVRDNRYVLPIKAHAKRWNLGIVHDVSGTGQTVFVEPHAIVELNNRLRLAEGRLKAAEHAILGQLSRELGTQHASLLTSTDAAITVDLACARAGLATRLQAVRPVVGSEGRIEARAARHPVLVLRQVPVVGNELAIGRDHVVLVLSGPNAGGKTVALKTFGLLAELVRHGNFVPAAEGTRVDLFQDVVAVIGDQQTVEGDLSSFSAHLVALRALLDRAAPDQLVLLDEIASGTDPAQGSALAQAVLEHLAARGPRVVVTTHFAPLKGLSATKPEFAAAAVQYRNGRPTYRLVAGAAGESHALDIAARVGLPAALLDRATALLGDQELELGRLIAALAGEREKVAALQEEAASARDDALRRSAEVARREEELKSRARALEQQASAKFVDRLKNAERAIGQVVAELQKAPSQRTVDAAKATVRALSALLPEEVAAERVPEPLQPGDRVRHDKLGVGEVVAVGDEVSVRAGAIVFRARAAELTRLGAPSRPPPPPPPPPKKKGAAAAKAEDEQLRMPSNTLDLRGMRVDEGQDATERFFDQALQRGHGTVFLLHGHGTGALKDGLRGWLRSCAYVRGWRPAPEDQGGDAFTVVTLS